MFEKKVQQLKKRKKSCSFSFEKNVLKTSVQFQRPLKVPVSHQHQTSLLRNADAVFTFIRNYARTVCDKCDKSHQTHTRLTNK